MAYRVSVQSASFYSCRSSAGGVLPFSLRSIEICQTRVIGGPCDAFQVLIIDKDARRCFDTCLNSGCSFVALTNHIIDVDSHVRRFGQNYCEVR
jgi:hypothetical protein